MDAQALRESVTNAIRYWEPRRLAYNAALAIIVVVYFFLLYPHSKSALTLDGFLGVFLLAVLANVAYCAAYVADVFAQLSGYRDQWRAYRWVVFLIGLAFAGVLTRISSLGIFGPATN